MLSTHMPSMVKKISEGEIFIRIQRPTLLQIFCKKIINFQVIFKGIKDLDDNLKGYS